MEPLSALVSSRPPAFAATGLPAFAAVQPPLKFKLGLVTYTSRLGGIFRRRSASAKRSGIAAVECRTTHKHGVEPSLTTEQRSDVKKQFADSGVVFWGCGSVCEFHAADPKVVAKNVEDCKKFVRLVADLGGKGVKVRPNGVPKGADPQRRRFEQIGRALVECGTAAADAGVEIWVEVHGAVTQEPKNCRAIMDACKHPSVGLTWNSNKTDIENKSVAARSSC